MKNEELLVCAKSVYNFLMKSDDEYKTLGHMNIPTNLHMIKMLELYNFNMWSFTLYLNDTLNMGANIKPGDAPTSFFCQPEKSRLFYKKAIDMCSRNKKIINLFNKLK
jgi:hypothetical protein